MCVIDAGAYFGISGECLLMGDDWDEYYEDYNVPIGRGGVEFTFLRGITRADWRSYDGIVRVLALFRSVWVVV